MTSAAVLSRLRVGVIVAGCVLVVSCSTIGRSPSQPVLKGSDVVGTWSNHNGSTIAFQADGRFSAVGMDMGPNLPGCGSVSGPGNWDFLSAQGDSASFGTYTSGNLVDLSFDGQNDSCDATLTSWEIDPPVGLCLDFDPDSPCTGVPWTKEH